MSTTLSPIASPEFAERTLADLAVTLPGATAVFRRRKLDFCCGGNISLRDAMQAKGQALDELQDELAQLVQAGGTPDTAQDVPALIERIETRYHAVHRRELPELARLARRVEAVHRENPGVPRGLADLLDRMTVELEAHMQKEEQVLFPLMLQGGHPMIGHPIAMMLSEHDDHGAHLRSLEALTQDFTLPEGACTSWRALYAGTRKFADDLVEHIHTENNILFPRFSN
jgi:regulator of cell morphogenesis and NO signaling